MLVEILVQAVTAFQRHLPLYHTAFGAKDLLVTRKSRLALPHLPSSHFPAAMSVVTDVNGSQDIQAQSYVGFDSRSISTAMVFTLLGLI